jgi:5-methylcytosine-specific restriction endonuclease McrA
MTPTPDFQLGFLSKLQRIFNEGEFFATYKFALIMAIADLCIDRGSDTDDALSLSYSELGEKFIAYYWQQSQRFLGVDGKGQVLDQSHGRQASIVKLILEFRERNPRETVNTSSRNAEYPKMLNAIARTIRDQPVKYLQNIVGGTDSFLFEQESRGICLRKGVSFCLRRFHPLVTQMARAQWIDHIRRITSNTQILGPSDDLESFLFSTSRQALGVLRNGLMDLRSRCFYCDRSIASGGDVDHFVPFSLYPRDIIPNFVLAHASCNRSKSNNLAAGNHLERWIDFTERHGRDLKSISQDAGIRYDERGSLSVALWAYKNASSSGGVAWRNSKSYVPVVDRDVALLEHRILMLSSTVLT